jgi:hypothetical protein
MSRDINEGIVRRFYTELWNDWNLEVADEILAPDLRFRGTLGTSDVGIEHFKLYFDRERGAFPDLNARIDELRRLGRGPPDVDCHPCG